MSKEVYHKENLMFRELWHFNKHTLFRIYLIFISCFFCNFCKYCLWIWCEYVWNRLIRFKFGIKFYENIPLKIVIKCKNADDKKKVFYMPFDKEYFGIRMKLKKGDMYVYSVSEAESNGFIYAHAK